MLQVDRDSVVKGLDIIKDVVTRWQTTLTEGHLPGVDVPATGITTNAWKRAFVHELLFAADLAQSLAARTVEIQE